MSDVLCHCCGNQIEANPDRSPREHMREIPDKRLAGEGPPLRVPCEGTGLTPQKNKRESQR